MFWCIGICADMFATYAQFGHAGASAGAAEETATVKNAALGSSGAVVPASFDELGDKIRKVKTGTIVPKAEVPPPPPPHGLQPGSVLSLLWLQRRLPP